MLAAIFGLAGVVVGALVSGGVELILERRREANAVARAKRLVLDELHNVWSHLDMLSQGGVTPQQLSEEARTSFLPTADWDAYRETLASPKALSEDNWIALTNLMYSAKQLRTMIFDLPPLSPLPVADNVKGLAQLSAELYTHLAGRPPLEL